MHLDINWQHSNQEVVCMPRLVDGDCSMLALSVSDHQELHKKKKVEKICLRLFASCGSTWTNKHQITWNQRILPGGFHIT